MLKLQTYSGEQQADSPLNKLSDNHLSDFKQTASVSSFFPSLSVGFCVADWEKKQVWSQLNSVSSVQWGPREVWGFALGEGGPTGVVHSYSECITSSWKSTRESERGDLICHWFVSVHANGICWSSQWGRTLRTFPYVCFVVFVSRTRINLLNIIPEPKPIINKLFAPEMYVH